MAFDMMSSLKAALEELIVDSDTRVVILTGAGKGLCSGADLEDPGYMLIFDGPSNPGIARRAMKVLYDVIKAIQDMEQPVIGAVNGAAISSGFCLAMADDIRIISEKSYFRATRINSGLTLPSLV